MKKRYINLSLVYAIIAMIFGVFYREFTKILAFTGDTKLSIIHTHYFTLGMFFFLILLLAEKSFSFSKQKGTTTILILYQVGLNISGLIFLSRGLMEVWGTELSRGMNSALSGIAGIGHMILGVSLVLLLLRIKKKVMNPDNL